MTIMLAIEITLVVAGAWILMWGTIGLSMELWDMRRDWREPRLRSTYLRTVQESLLVMLCGAALCLSGVLL